MRVLVVDDAIFMRIMIKDMLAKAGHEVIGEASNGVEGLAKYKELNPDVVTLDITMPVMGGLDCLKEIINYDKDAKVIMCSAMGQQPIVLDAVKIGAKDFLVKPFQASRVSEALRKLSE